MIRVVQQTYEQKVKMYKKSKKIKIIKMLLESHKHLEWAMEEIRQHKIKGSDGAKFVSHQGYESVDEVGKKGEQEEGDEWVTILKGTSQHPINRDPRHHKWGGLLDE